MVSAFDYSNATITPWIKDPKGRVSDALFWEPTCHHVLNNGLECLFILGKGAAVMPGFVIRFPRPALWMFTAGDEVSQSLVHRILDSGIGGEYGYKIQQSPLLSDFNKSEELTGTVSGTATHYTIPTEMGWLHVIDSDDVDVEWYEDSPGSESLAYYGVAA